MSTTVVVTTRSLGGAASGRTDYQPDAVVASDRLLLVGSESSQATSDMKMEGGGNDDIVRPGVTQSFGSRPSAVASSLDEMGVVDASNLPVAIGQIIAGRYAISGVLGRGGMGVVLAGRHLELGEPVAIKFLNREYAAYADRFFREARAAARIRSEHVVRIFDVGRLDSGEPFIVMEHLEGNDVSERLVSAGSMPLQTVADIILDVCQALAEAHAVGIVHRDLKPANIFLARGPDGEDLVKLLDFGIAKMPEAGAITKTASLLGSPVYMSPEQLLASRDVDARADIWSLGVIVYEMLTATLPFQGDSIVHLALLIREKPTPSVRDLKPDLPLAIDDLIGRCLAKDRNDRFANVAEFAEAIAPFASPGLAHSTSRIRRVLLNAKPRRDAALESTVPSSDPAIPTPPRSSDPAVPTPSSPHKSSSETTGNSSHAKSPIADSVETRVETLDAVSTSSSNAIPLISPRVGRDARQSSRWRGGLAVMALCGGIGFALWRFSTGSHSETADPSAKAKASQEPSTSLSTVATTIAPPPEPSTLPSAPATTMSSQAAAAALPTPTPTHAPVVVVKKDHAPKPTISTAATVPSTPPTLSTPPKPPVNCNPPYTIDANGVRRAKPECL